MGWLTCTQVLSLAISVFIHSGKSLQFQSMLWRSLCAKKQFEDGVFHMCFNWVG